MSAWRRLKSAQFRKFIAPGVVLAVAVALLPALISPAGATTTAASIAFTTQPGDGAPGTDLATQPVVTTYDSHGDVLSTSDSISMTLENSDGTAINGFTALTCPNATADSGVATFSGCQVNRGGMYKLVAHDDSLTVKSSAFYVSGPAKLVFTKQPSGGTAGTTWTTQPQVTVENAKGVAIATSTVAIKLNVKAGTGTPGADLGCAQTDNIATASAGVADFSGCDIDHSGANYQLQAFDTADLLTATSSTFDVDAGPVDHLAFAPQPSGAVGGADFTQQPVVSILDSQGNVAIGNTDQVTMTIKSGTGTSGASLTCPATSAVDGVASFTGCQIDKAGTGYVLVAHDSTASKSVESDPFNVAPGNATGISFTVQPGGGPGGSAFAQQPVVKISDAGGNGVAGTVALSIVPGTGASGAVLACSANPAASATGIVSFDGCSISKSGTDYRLRATKGAFTVDSDKFDVTEGVAAHLAFTTQPGDGDGGTALSAQPVVRVTDLGGNTVAGTVSLAIAAGTGTPGATLSCTDPVSISGGNATFSDCAIDKAGLGYRLVATSGDAHQVSDPFDVAVGDPAQLAFTTQPGGGTGGLPWGTQPIVAVQDAGGNQVPSSEASIRLAITTGTGSGHLTCTANELPAVRGVAQFDGCRIDRTASDYQLTATDAVDHLTVDSDTFAVTAGAPAGLKFTGQPGGSTAGTTFTAQPAVTVVDAGGNPVDNNADVTLEVTPGTGAGGTLSCDAGTLNAAPTADYTGCSIDTAGSGYTLTATTAGGLQAESDPFAILLPPPSPLGQVPTNVPVAQTFGGRDLGVNPTNVADGVNTATGELTFSREDLKVAGIGMPFDLLRTYNSADTTGGAFGPGWTSLLDMSVKIAANKQTATVRGADGQQIVFTPNPAGGWLPPAGARASLACTANVCTVTRFDGEQFQASTSTGKVSAFLSPNGVGLKFAWTATKVTISVRTTNKNPLNVIGTLDANGHVTQLASPTRHVSYGYNASGLLTGVTDVMGNTWSYAYANGLLTSETDPLGHLRLTASYDANGRVAATTHQGSAQHVDDTFDWGANTGTRNALMNVNGTDTRESYVDTYVGNVLVRQIDPLGATVRYSYDANVNLIEVQDPTGWVKQLAYDAANNLVQVTSPISSTSAAVVHMTWDSAHRMLTETDADGNTTTQVYNSTALGFVRAPGVTPGVGYTYDANYDLTKIQTAVGQQVFTYDAAGNPTGAKLQTLKGVALNGKGSLATYNEIGQRLTSVDPRGNGSSIDPHYRATWTYDAAGRLLSQTLPGGASTSTTYNKAGDVTSTTNANGTSNYLWDESTLTLTITGPHGQVTTQRFDPSGNLLAETDSLSNRSTTHRYDAAGREISTTDPAGVTTNYSYDLNGNVVAASDDLGNTLTRQFDSLNRPIREVNNGVETRTTWDPAGNVVAQTDADGNVTHATYNSHELISSVTTGAGTTKYAYDPATDELLSTTDGNDHVTTYAYDAAQRRISMTRNGAVTKYGYDLGGNVNSIVDPDGRTTSITFNAMNLPTNTTYTQSGKSPVSVQQTYDAFGRRTSMTDAFGTHTYSYDQAGNLTSATVPGGTFSYDYSQPGKILETYPDGTQVQYGIDDSGNLMSLESGTPGSANYVKVSYVRDLRREVTGIAYSNGAFETRQYDNAGNLLDQQLRNAGGPLSDDRFSYDAAGNRLTQQYTVGGVTTANAYGYDTTGRLTSFRTDSGPGSLDSQQLPDSGLAGTPNTSSVINGGGTTAAAFGVTTSVDAGNGAHTTYGYDAVGNRTSISGATSQSTSFDAGDQVTTQSGDGAVAWSHDKSGHVTKLGNETLGYDAAGRLVSVTSGGSTITYQYDGDGNRIVKTSGGNTTKYTWDPMGALPQLALEQDGSGNLIRRYFYGDGAVAMQTPSATYFMHHDPVGSTTELTDESGNVVASYTYDAFGNVKTTGDSPPANPLLFQGQYFDSDTGLYYMRARYYDPSSGRFLSHDPKSPGVGVPAETPYAFASNRPTVLTDPTGESSATADTFEGKTTAAANGTNDTKMGVTGVTLGVKATAKLGGYSAAVTEASLSAKIGADLAPEAAAAAKTGSNLAKGAVGLAVIGIALQAATTVLDCMYADAYTCAGDVVGLTVNIAFTVGCSFVTGGVAAAACGIAGALISTGLQIVIAKFGPQIVDAFVQSGLFYAQAFSDLGNAIADISVQAFNGASELVQQVGGAIVSGFNSATTAIASGFDSAMKTLASAGYAAVQLADVIANGFLEGAKDAIAGLVALGYDLSDIGKAVADVFSTTAVQFAGMLKDGFNYGAQQIAQALSDAYHTAADIAAGILKDLDFAVDQVAGALQGVYDKAAAEAAAILDDIGYGFGQIADALNSVYAATDKFVADTLHTLGATAAQAITALRDFFGDADEAAAKALDFATYEVNQIANALKSAYNTVAQRAAEIFDDMTKTATEIAGALLDAFHTLDTDAALILRGLGDFLVTDVADALRDAYSDAADVAATALKTVGYTVVQIGEVLGSEFGKLADEAAGILKGIGYDVVAIGDALKNAFGQLEDQVVTILAGLDYVATEVADALKNVFTSDGAQQIANYLLGAFGLSDVATALSNVFFQTTEEIAQIFKNIGETATEIANALASAFNLAGDAIAGILTDIGEAAADIANVLENVFGEATDAIGNLLSSLGFSDDTISAIGGAFESFGQDVADCFSSFFSDC